MITTTGESEQVEKAGERAEPIPVEEAERRFRQMMEEPLSQAADIGSADIVVGIPFYNEADTIASAVQTVRQGLDEFYPGQKAIITAVGSPAGSECLEVIRGVPQSEAIRHIAFLLDDERVNGKGWAIRAAMEIARMAGADLAILEADLIGLEISRLTTDRIATTRNSSSSTTLPSRKTAIQPPESRPRS